MSDQPATDQNVNDNRLETYRLKTLGKTSKKHGLAPVSYEHFDIDDIDTALTIEHISYSSDEPFYADSQTAYLGTIAAPKITTTGTTSLAGDIMANEIRGEGDLIINGAYTEGDQIIHADGKVSGTNIHATQNQKIKAKRGLELGTITAQNDQTLRTYSQKTTISTAIAGGDQQIYCKSGDLDVHIAVAHGHQGIGDFSSNVCVHKALAGETQGIGDHADDVNVHKAVSKGQSIGYKADNVTVSDAFAEREQTIGSHANKVSLVGLVFSQEDQHIGDDPHWMDAQAGEIKLIGDVLAHGKQYIASETDRVTALGRYNPSDRQWLNPGNYLEGAVTQEYDVRKRGFPPEQNHKDVFETRFYNYF